MELVNESLICLHADVKTAEEAIHLAADRLMQEGFVTSDYAQAVIEREKTYPTGLAGAGYNIAIPHTNPEFVIKPGVAVVIPKDPIIFAMMGTPAEKLACQMIFPLAMKSPDKQLQLLMKLMSFFQNSEVLKQVYEAKEAKTIMELMKELEN
ncbi:PTS sugar transporter subunit IIA [Brevibacillus daliensis]|uniref:PTS sugar transporter subunit IIA n=1 Tax=Brevibacillus daliensis TaxID=2892995 RepID=UPI001E580681|nr:PTS sugar transporter subunit IIA [Brevibacillus daliensis]